MMGRVHELGLLSLLLVSLLITGPTWAKRGGSSKKPSFSSNKGSTHSKPSSSQPGNYPRQPQSPNRNPNPYPAGGSYPGAGNTNPGGYPRQNPASYPGAGSYPNQNPAGYPRQNQPGYPGGGSYPNQNPAGYPRQNQPNYPGAGGYPNQNPAGYPRQNQPGYPAAGGYPNQNPGAGYPNQYPGRGNYPNQYPAAGGYPAGGGYPNQYPGRGGYPNQYPGAGGYPAAGGYPNQYPGRGGYPNWNPNNHAFNSRFGGGGYGYGGYGMGGGSPFSRTVQGMGVQPKSTGFAKKAMLAAGVGAVAGMAVGYGLGRFPRPHFNFRSPQEEYYYNNYMYRQYGKQSTDEKDFGRDYEYKIPPRAEPYEKFMGRCMNETSLSKEEPGLTTAAAGAPEAEDDDTVSIEEIGYPALIEQVKSRRCVEKYMAYSAQFLEPRSDPQLQPGGSSTLSCGWIQLLTSCTVLLSSTVLLQ